MEPQTSQQTAIDSESLQNLQKEIQQEFIKNLKKANFGEILEKYGISEEKILKFQCIIDLNKIQDNSNISEKHKTKDFTEKALFQRPNKIVELDWCPPEGFCSSP
ncbi:hypothetical protein CDG76_14770 [Nostoc sp. 'Peltigera membranacea cyanobiont' 210A]|uniref:hypothetical protein n=1 Tax=Nostoc sp. 'Peltigera membranacea cyanobiont' 210A TaxID=2014529 RepID=UPI000B958CFC|nr:hypothetical protein [Nostoc sp. 'Peltigera membranacea cyanobiont' 210A]OYD94657.1 hypothetical protein CDG76_14770 [Nostoc sp. 'Peltigera membranacea cyanobiont' 210A]